MKIGKHHKYTVIQTNSTNKLNIDFSFFLFRREREQRVEQMQEEKEKMRQKIAREKVSQYKHLLPQLPLHLPIFHNSGQRPRRETTRSAGPTTANDRRAPTKNHPKATGVGPQTRGEHRAYTPAGS